MCTDDSTKKRAWEIWDAGQNDPQYRAMLEENRILEKKYFAVLETLPEEQQDIINDFVMLCEDMSWRMLEIACEMEKSARIH